MNFEISAFACACFGVYKYIRGYPMDAAFFAVLAVYISGIYINV